MSLPTAPEPHAPPDLMVAAAKEIRRLRGDLATAEAKVGRMAHGLGLEAHWLGGMAAQLEAIRRPPLDVVIRVADCRARAAELEEFVRSLGAEPTEPAPEDLDAPIGGRR